jgi:hypothetical protein
MARPVDMPPGQPKPDIKSRSRRPFDDWPHPKPRSRSWGVYRRGHRLRGPALKREAVRCDASADREREAGVRGVPGLFADSNRAPVTNPTGRATRVPVSARVPVRACILRCLSSGMRREVRLQVGERVGEARVVWLDLQQRLVTADRSCRARSDRRMRRSPVRCRSCPRSCRFGLWGPRSRWAPATLRRPPGGLGVGLPWRPPVAAFASVPTMSTGKRDEKNPDQLHGLSIGWTAREHDWPNG